MNMKGFYLHHYDLEDKLFKTMLLDETNYSENTMVAG